MRFMLSCRNAIVDMTVDIAACAAGTGVGLCWLLLFRSDGSRVQVMSGGTTTAVSRNGLLSLLRARLLAFLR